MRAAMLPVTLLSIGVVASSARAEDPAPRPAPGSAPGPALTPTRDRTRVTSYRRYTLTADVVSLGMLVAGGLAEGKDGEDTALSTNLMAVGSMSVMFATPIIHGIRGHFGRSLGSLALRSGLGGLGGMLGFGMADCRNSDEIGCGIDQAAVGMVVGLAVASAIDAGALTDERDGRTGWAPQVAVTHDRVQVGVAAAF